MSADILIVDDEADIRMLLSGILEDEGYRVGLRMVTLRPVGRWVWPAPI